ncbi:MULTISPECIES: ABC transporter ATP-binding protein [unclassified Streptomyces]|uniref:ABC transporter ATP-binding protein n=1 Tax=unclassified Streptomyces TaxID=2593676 RepID=UPI001646D553|nr:MULTISPECIES: ABC transporter ATP-binding protein [unclassified Streptomyces]
MAAAETEAETGRTEEPTAGPRGGPDPLLGLLGTVRGRLSLSLAIGATSGALGVAGLVLLGFALDELSGPKPSGATAIRLLTAAAVAMTGRFALRKWAFDVSHLASFALETTLRRSLAEHLSTVPLGKVQALGSGTLKKVVQDDVRALHSAVADSTPMIGAGLAQPVAALVALAVIDWRLLLAVLAVIPAVAIGFRLVTRDYATQRRAYDEANEAVNEAVVEFVQGMPVVRTFDDGTTSFTRFAERVQEFTRATEAWQRQGKTAGVLTRAAMTPLPTLVIVLAVGTWLVSTGSLSVIDLALATLLGTMPVESVVPLMYLSSFITESRAGAMRINAILEIDPLLEPAKPRRPADGSVAFSGVVFSYEGEGQNARKALDDVSLKIPDGSVCALVGASGSGKSTVARLIPRFWDVDAGSVSIGGVDVREVASNVLLSHVGMVFQDPFLLDDTVAENIRLARPEASDEEVRAAARAAQADEFIRNELPKGYETRVGERGGHLSGGQRQRITIARALLADSPVIVLDEATAFADPENEAAIQRGLAELTRGRTVVVIAHRLSTIVDADQIAVLHRGRVVESGRHDELLAADGRYAAMWRQHTRADLWGLDGRTQVPADDNKEQAI